MPNFITHTYFGDMVAQKLDSDSRLLIAENKNIFYIGTNGPDVFFPFRELNFGAKHFSNKMHNVKVCEVFQSTADYIRNKNDNSMLAYVLGLQCHYALDSVVHPFVFYAIERGFFKEYQKRYQKGIHTIIEIAYDEYVLKEIKKIDIKEYDPSGLIANTKEDRAKVALLYQEAINPVLGFNVFSKDLMKSINLVNIFHKLTNDKKGRRKKFILLLEKLLWNDQTKMSNFVKPVYESDKFDFLNLEKREFYKVRNECAISNESFTELFDRAQNIAVDNIKEYIKAIYDGSKIDKKRYCVNYEGIKDPTLL